MKRFTLLALLGVALLLTTVAAQTEDAEANGGSKLVVTVTNLTKGQILSPFIVATHSSRLEPLFRLGSPASSELAYLAEDAMLDPLKMLWEGSKEVKDVEISSGPVPPGESVSVTVRAGGRHKYVSLGSMLVTTNDAFTALNGVRAPSHGYNVHMTSAYDAGSETNNETCATIPGPPCMNGGVRDTSAAEGYVYIHSGIHGIADLMPADHDWSEPGRQDHHPTNPLEKLSFRKRGQVQFSEGNGPVPIFGDQYAQARFSFSIDLLFRLRLQRRAEHIHCTVRCYDDDGSTEPISDGAVSRHLRGDLEPGDPSEHVPRKSALLGSHRRHPSARFSVLGRGSSRFGGYRIHGRTRQ